MDRIGEGLKKVILAGIGAAALTGEKTSEILGTLVEKGELTVEQGKVLNEELKHTVKEKYEDLKAEAEKTAEPAGEETVDEVAEEAGEDPRDAVAKLLEGMDDAQVSQLKALLEGVAAARAAVPEESHDVQTEESAE